MPPAPPGRRDSGSRSGLGGLPAPPPTPRQHPENTHNLSLRFDTNGNVDVNHDLKLWVRWDRTPTLRTVGTFNGSLQLWHSQVRWHAQGNQVSASPA